MDSSLCYPPSVLAIMFGYQPPNDVTTPKYRAVGEARDRFEVSIAQIVADRAGGDNSMLSEGQMVALHARVSMAALDYAQAINAVAPTSDHVVRLSLGAIDSVTLARMWLNKALRASDAGARGRLVALAKTESEKAQLLANAGIALDQPVADAYSALND